MSKNGVTVRASPSRNVGDDQRLGELVERRSPQRRCRARAASDAPRVAPPSGDACAARRRRTGWRCSGRRASGAPGRCRRRRGSASSARTSARSLTVGLTKNSARVGRCGERLDRRRRRDEDEAQVVAEARQQLAQSPGSASTSTSACSDEPSLPSARSASICRFDSARDLADALATWRAAPASTQARDVAVGLDEDRRRALRREHLPRLLGGEAEERRHPAQHRVGDVPERGLRRAPRVRLRRRRVEAVLQDVEVERAEVLGAEHLQLGDDRVELVDAVVAAGEDAARLRRSVPTISACSAAVRASAQRSISSISRERHRIARRDRSRWCWRAGSAACCGSAGTRRRRGRGSCRRSPRSPE